MVENLTAQSYPQHKDKETDRPLSEGPASLLPEDKQPVGNMAPDRGSQTFYTLLGLGSGCSFDPTGVTDEGKMFSRFKRHGGRH